MDFLLDSILFLQDLRDFREGLVTSTIDAAEAKGPDAVIEGIARGFVSDALSGYNIKNVDNFLKQISAWVYRGLISICSMVLAAIAGR